MPQKIEVEISESSGGSPILARDQITASGLQAGSDAVTVIISNEAHTLPTTSTGVVTYTGSGTAGDTIGHGLSSVAPNMIMIKNISSIDSWAIYHSSLGNTIHLALDTTAAEVTSSAYWNSTSPTSTVFTVGTGDALNQSTKNYVAYCFANCEGYIKAGSYEGNGNADGSFVYTGFRPAFIMTKSIDSTSDWQVFDKNRAGYNVDNNELQVNETDAESTTDMIDILSNGFKLRIATDPNVAETYVYLAFAHNPFQYATAR